MKRLLTIALLAILALGSASMAKAEPPAEPGRNHGLCTAFFNGQKNGHDKQKAEEGGEYPGPFEALINDAPDGSDDNDTGGDVADLYEWCQQYGIGGNEDHGRYDCVITEDNPATAEDESDTTCTEDNTPGNK